MFDSSPPTPPMSSSDLKYRGYHLSENPSKLHYQDSENNSNCQSSQSQFFQPSTPRLSSPEAQSGHKGDDYFPPLAENTSNHLPQGNPSIEQLESLISLKSGSEANTPIFGDGTYDPDQQREQSRKLRTMNQPPPTSHYANCEKMSLMEDEIYSGDLYIHLHDMPSPLPVPLITVRRARRPVAIVKSPETGKTVTRVRKAPRIRKAAAEKTEKPKVPKLDRPLSELTHEYSHLPIRDMDSWVNRSAEVRKEEVNKRGGYITRPMNSFMLYRSAFAERTKFWCLQNNHQVVSAVSGVSWPLESESIRAKYNELARIERINHQLAHPGYKFSPSKAQTSKKRKGTKFEDQSEESDFEDPVDDPEYFEKSSDKRKRSQRQSRKAAKGQDFQNGPMAVSNKYFELLGVGEGGASRSSFAATNPGKTPPACMGSVDMTGQYYQTTIQASRATPVPNGNSVIEDITIQKTQTPGRSSNINLGQVWVSSGMYTNNYGWNQEGIEGIMNENSKVDPMLLVQDVGNGQCGTYDSQPSSYILSDDIDEGFEMGNFDIDPLFQTDGEGSFGDFHNPMGGDDVHVCENQDGYEPSSNDSAVDVQYLPAYHENMHGFIDNNDPWTVIKDESCGNGLKYDEWLQE